MSSILKKLAILTVFGLTAGFLTHAQLPLSIGLSLSATPASPSPGETVTIKAFAPSFSKETARFSWTVNGAYRADFSGTGRNSIQLTAPDNASSIRIALTVSDQNAQESTALTIPVSNLTLLWFADTTAPLWYKGKTLPTPGSKVSVIAIPAVVLGGRTLPSSELIFRWSVGDQKNLLTGAGQDVFTFETSKFANDAHYIQVEIEDTGGRMQKEGSILVRLGRPHVALYASSPLGGTEYRSSPSFIFRRPDALSDIIAEIFFFPKQAKQKLNYQWQINGNDITQTETPQNPNILTVDARQYNVTSIPLTISVRESDNVLAPLISNTATLIFE